MKKINPYLRLLIIAVLVTSFVGTPVLSQAEDLNTTANPVVDVGPPPPTATPDGTTANPTVDPTNPTVPPTAVPSSTVNPTIDPTVPVVPPTAIPSSTVNPTTDSIVPTTTATGTPDGNTAPVDLVDDDIPTGSNTPPVITILGYTLMTITVGTPFVDEGITAYDAEDGVIASSSITTVGTVDTNTVGTYILTYTATDSEGLSSRDARAVSVVSQPNTNTPPVLTILGDNPMTITVGDTFADPGAFATDAEDGPIATSSITVTSTVDASTVGAYTISYFVQDSNGATATATRGVTVVDRNTSGSSNGGGNHRGGGGVSGGSLAPLNTASVVPISLPLPPGQVLGVEDFRFLFDLNHGMKSSAVMELQTRLRAEGFFSLPMNTGFFGPMTLDSVKKYQTAHGISPTGFVGPITRGVLNAR